MEINLQRKKEFLTYFQNLQEQKNSFLTKDQLAKIKTDDNTILLFDCFLWNYRDLYLKLFVSFLNYNICGDEFANQLIRMRVTHIRKFDKLIEDLQIINQVETNFEFLNKFDLTMDAFGFPEMIDLVYENCDSFVSDKLLEEIGGPRENGELDENQFRQRIKKAFLLISQKSIEDCNDIKFELEEYRMGVDQSSKELVNRSFKFLTSISVLFGILLVIPY